MFIQFAKNIYIFIENIEKIQEFAPADWTLSGYLPTPELAKRNAYEAFMRIRWVFVSGGNMAKRTIR